MRGDYFYRHPISRSQKARLLLVFICLSLTVLLGTAAFHFKPILVSMATARVTNMVNRVTAEAVNEIIDSGNIEYDELITFEKDNDGKVTAVKSDMAEFNRLQSQILHKVLEKISSVDTKELAIPLGNLTGNALLAGRGPLIRVRMQSIGSSTAYLKNAFSSAGINQTKHQIVLYVDVTVSILLPGFATATKVSNAFIVAETVIVGSVPDSYTYFSSQDPNDPSEQETARDYILNKG